MTAAPPARPHLTTGHLLLPSACSRSLPSRRRTRSIHRRKEKRPPHSNTHATELRSSRVINQAKPNLPASHVGRRPGAELHGVVLRGVLGARLRGPRPHAHAHAVPPGQLRPRPQARRFHLHLRPRRPPLPAGLRLRVRRSARPQVVGWPPVSRNRRNALPSGRGKFVKVAVAGAPYQRKVDLEAYAGYDQLLAALQDKFTSHFTVRRRAGSEEMALVDVVSGAEYVPTYEDKDADWMLVGDVPWRMFVETCQRLRLMKSSEVVTLAPRAAE